MQVSRAGWVMLVSTLVDGCRTLTDSRSGGNLVQGGLEERPEVIDTLPLTRYKYNNDLLTYITADPV